MRILHTADWHVGRRLGRHDRMPEHRAALEEVAEIADAEAVDLVVVSGDVFDRPSPPVDALSLGLQALQRLAETRPVVAVAGNHDAPELFDALAPLLRDRRVHLIGAIRPPDAGGVLGPEELGVPAVVAAFPFLREGRVVDFMAETGRWYGQYAEKVAAIAAAYNAAVIERAGTDLVPILVAHFMVSGVRVAHSERELHIGDAYTTTPQAIPAGAQYVALGHIHAPQSVPGANVPAEYAGSLLALDFGEAGEQKRVVVVDAEPGRLATVRSVPITSGRPLVRARGTWDELAGRGAGRCLPRPHGLCRRARSRARSPCRRDLPVSRPRPGG
jgi:exonuclease SbcD